jgi:hypothetical protein
MTIKKTAVSTSIVLASVLAMGASMSAFAQTEEMPKIVDGDSAIIECIPKAEVDAMNAADKEKLTLPTCEDIDGKNSEKNKEDSGAATQ